MKKSSRGGIKENSNVAAKMMFACTFRCHFRLVPFSLYFSMSSPLLSLLLPSSLSVTSIKFCLRVNALSFEFRPYEGIWIASTRWKILSWWYCRGSIQSPMFCARLRKYNEINIGVSSKGTHSHPLLLSADASFPHFPLSRSFIAQTEPHLDFCQCP